MRAAPIHPIALILLCCLHLLAHWSQFHVDGGHQGERPSQMEEDEDEEDDHDDVYEDYDYKDGPGEVNNYRHNYIDRGFEHDGAETGASTGEANSTSSSSRQASVIPCGVTKLYMGRRSAASVADEDVADAAQAWDQPVDDPVATSGRIYQGKEVRPGELAYQLRLEGYLGFQKFLCGAVLIDESWALTAGHCVAQVMSGRGRIVVTAGEHSVSNSRENEIVVGVDRYYVHPGFYTRDYPTFVIRNDIALIKLRRPIALKITPNGYGSINRVCLPDTSVRYSRRERVTMSGWGQVNDYGFVANVLQKLTYVAEIHYSPNGQFICTSPGLGRGRGTCSGDSGGPLVRWTRGGGSGGGDKRLWQAELIGLTSYGPAGCGTAGYSCFTQVSKYRGWIKSITGL